MRGTYKKFDHPTLPGLFNAISSPVLEAGPTPLPLQAGHLIAPSGQEAAHASPLAQPEKGLEQVTKDISGPSSPASSASFSLQQSLANRLRARLDVNGSPEYSLTWREWAIQGQEPICALRGSVLRTSDSGCIGWPTPTVQDAGKATHRYREDRQNNLTAIVAMRGWATPTCRGVKNSGDLTNYINGRNGKGRNDQMSCQVFGMTANSFDAVTGKHAVLSPDLPRWVMGYPQDWCACAVTAMQSFRK